jgi:hypothetical protein
LTDAEKLGSLTNTIDQYIAWIDHFGNSQVGFQIGYPSDISWWSTFEDPASEIMNPVIAARPNANIGAIFWVDFSVLAPFPDTGGASITINDVTLDEGNFGTSNFVFTITRSTNTQAMSVQYQTADNTATSPTDYVPIPPTTLNFPSGGPFSQTITVPVNHDIAVEPDETFNVNLSNCTGGCIILDAQGIGTIKNDDLPGPFILNFGSFGSSNGQFRSPLDVAVDSADRILVADYNNHRIQIFNSAGNHLQSIGSLGSSNGQFSYPTSITVDSADRILVADSNNHRIQIFNSAGNHLQSIGSLGSSNGQFSTPTGIAIRSEDRIAVADSGNHRIETLVSSGAYLQSFGSFGSSNGQFSFPSGIEVDSADRVIVADTGNHRIQISQGSPPLDLDSDGISDDFDTENIIDLSQTLSDSHIVIGNITIQSGVVLTIPNGQSLTVPSGNNITIKSGGGVLIQSGGILQIIS